MAYYDFDGKITIDEAAAEKDVRNIRAAREILVEAKRSIDRLFAQASESTGDTAAAILEKAQELAKKVDVLVNRLDESAHLIQKTVAHYQEVDRQVKAAIAAASVGNGGN